MSVESILIPIAAFTRSGGNRVLCRFATEWVRSGRRVAFLVLDDTSTPTFETSAEIIYCNSIIAGLVAASRSSGRLGTIMDIHRLARAIRKCGPSYDAILASHSFTALSCFLAGVSSRTTYYVQGYDPEVMRTKRTPAAYVAATLAYMSYWLCRKQVVNSPHYSEHAAIRTQRVIPPGVDATVFQPKSQPAALDGDELKIGIIGRAEPHKFRPVLEAYRRIQQQHPQCKLLIAYGNIPEAELVDVNRYEIVRPTSDIGLAAFYRRCDVFLALSEFPKGAFYPPLEALASGVFLISNRFLLVDDSNSWIVDTAADVPKAFAALLSASSEERLAKMQRGVQTVQTQLDWTSLAVRLAQVLDENCSGLERRVRPARSEDPL